jgi:beta-phosphoglucomutase-like phosphatase (HAD superfamily)
VARLSVRNKKECAVMTISALIFGGIGTLVETSELQRQAFNMAFDLLNIDFNWSKSDYQGSLSQSGGAYRLGQIVLASGAPLSHAQVSAVHSEKTRIFGDLLLAQTLPLRPGVESLIATATAKGLSLAWATTTSDANIDAVISATGGKLNRAMFQFIGNDQSIAGQKPDPEIYNLALKRLQLLPAQALAIEDSPTGISAARAASIRAIAFPGALHFDKDFSAADGITYEVSHLLYDGQDRLAMADSISQ